MDFPSKTTAYGTLAVELLALNSDFHKKEVIIPRTTSMLAVGGMVSRHKAQCLIPAGA